MPSEITTIPLPEVAFILRARLGLGRNWTNFLTDNIRGRQSVSGLTLLPCGKQHDGRSFRPIYAVPDVLAFIENVLATEPEAGKTPIKTTKLAIDKSRGWRINKFNKAGAPITLPRTSSSTTLHP